MFLKVKTYKQVNIPDSYIYEMLFDDYVIININEITSINNSLYNKPANIKLDRVPGKKLYEIHLPSNMCLVDQDDANKIFKVIKTSM